MLHGPYSTVDRDRPLIRLPFTSFAVATVLLPLTGLLACLFISLLYHYEDSTYTHCQVTTRAPPPLIHTLLHLIPNSSRCCFYTSWHIPSVVATANQLSLICAAATRSVPACTDITALPLPSVRSPTTSHPSALPSAACRSATSGAAASGCTQRQRYLVSVAYFSFYRRRFDRKLPELVLSGLALLCSLAENSGLLMLTYVSSTETYDYHKKGFIVFVASSLLHMLITCRLWFVIKRHYEVTSYLWKLRLFLFNISCCGAAAYCFRRHNKFCEDGVYTVFAFFEYLVVFSNMAFHMTAFWDFGSKDVMVATLPEDKRY
ncbi:Post-GPI attachment to proteins factor 2 [Oryzias melastigma]|uniref:Acyltransferase PGAP2 n=1 Tax=Oryzias melastigma TaxID=30732 RepID=A0A834FT63_ORYME|nr:Post-GPI attachment to proteins factor 2 [Oryzias melastigma]